MQTLLQLVQPIGTIIFLIVAALVVLSPTIIGPLVLRRWLSHERQEQEHWRSWLSFAVSLAWCGLAVHQAYGLYLVSLRPAGTGFEGPFPQLLIAVPFFVLLFLPAFPSLLVSTIAVAKNGRTLFVVPILIAVILGGLLLSGYLSGVYRKWRARYNAARRQEMAIETWRELNPDLVEEQERAASEKRIALERIRHWDAFGFLPPYEGEVVVVLSTIRTRPADWTALREVPELRQLISQLTPTNDADLENLRHTPHLRELYLAHTGISDEGLSHLRNVPDLVLLDLRGDPAVTDKGLEHLHPLSHLQSLTLEGTGVSALGVVRLQILCPDVQAIDVPGALGYPRRQWTKRYWETARTILGEEAFQQALRDAGLDGIPADAPEEPAENESDVDDTQESLGR